MTRTPSRTLRAVRFWLLGLMACTSSLRSGDGDGGGVVWCDLETECVEQGRRGLDCDAIPKAYVWHGTGDANDAPDRLDVLLANAGFEVRALPRDVSPKDLRGVIMLGSQASEDPAYAVYMERYAGALRDFVGRGNVLLQFAQNASVEGEPPFLPPRLHARRGAGRLDGLTVLSPEGALVWRAQPTLLPWRGPGEVESAFVSQQGFQVVIAAEEAARTSAMLEAAYGRGRMILSALPLDLSLGRDGEAAMFRERLYRRLFTHTGEVCQRRAHPLQIQTDVDVRFDPDSSMLVVMPDTQVYSINNPGLFHAQTTWIAENARARDIRYVLHLGDIVHNNSEAEWRRASAAMKTLHRVVSYALVPGNHDYGPSGNASTRDTLLNDFFDFETHSAMPGFGGAFEEGRLDNTYHLFSVGGRSFVLLALEWGPRNSVLEWASDVMNTHLDREGILITHAYLNNGNRRYDHTDSSYSQRYNPHDYGTPGGVNDGEELWQKLVRKHRFVMTINGHVLGDQAGYRKDQTDAGTTCHQILANFQLRDLGGEGYLRLLEFMPDGKTVRTWAYSALYEDFLMDPSQEIVFEL